MKHIPFRTSSYQTVNILVGLIILSGFFWLLILSGGNADYPVECVHIKYTGNECATCGLSRSLSAMIKGDLSLAGDYNRNGPLLFAFFASQFIMRVLAGYSIFRINGWRIENNKTYQQSGGSDLNHKIFGEGPQRIRSLAVADTVISMVLFLICFRYLFIFW